MSGPDRTGAGTPGPARLHARVRGVVQGVGFRAFTVRQGRALGLNGWARNLPDGTVEVLAEGPEPDLRQLERRLRAGPPTARVDWVDAEYSRAQGEPPGFNVRY